MTSDERKTFQKALDRRREITAKLSRFLRPRLPEPPLPTADDFEKLLDRFEREYTIAFNSWVWRTTWVELNRLAERLFVDRGDLREFYACDYVVDLILAREIPGVTDDIRNCMVGAGPLETLETIAARYVANWKDPRKVPYVTLCNLQTLIHAYSPPDISRLQILERTIEVLRQAGADLDEDHPVVRDWRATLHCERAERYAREKETVARGSAMTPSGPTDDLERSS